MRARDASVRWKELYMKEAEACEAQRQLVKQGQRALQKVKEMRDAALEKQRVAEEAAAVAKNEKARWRARADAQFARRVPQK